jgi:electron transfer flavoprotein alpha subunit
MNGMHIVVVIPPWLAGRADREAFARTASAIAGTHETSILDFTGRAPVAAFAARVAQSLGGAQSRLVLLPAGPEGEEAAALIAAQCAGASLGRCTQLELDGDTVGARRAVFGGRAQAVVRSNAKITCATLRPDATSASNTAMPAPQTVAIDEPAQFEGEPVSQAATHPRLEGASLVVSGGRGIGAPEGFDLLARVARLLGAGLGGSLPAVDAGWVPVAHQVGQSGKFVSPKVYFAVAISGTPQHLAGVSGTARIVALNSDKDAPIFARCDVGVVGDWREILPLVATELEAAAGSRRG